MLSRIEGQLAAVHDDGRAEVTCGALTYELLIPAAELQRLSRMVGETIQLHTLHYLEGHGQGSSFVPRLIGFGRPDDRAFFELFTTVKGLGARKALRALQLPFGAVAQAIASRDLALLVSLPEIGRRTAETIVAELHGKVDRFVELKPAVDEAVDAETLARRAVTRDAVAVLTQLGESQLTAHQLVDRALSADPSIDEANALVAAALRVKD